MNINEVKNNNSIKSTDGINIQSSQSYTKKSDRREFYTYVDASSSASSTDNQSDENIQSAENEDTDNLKEQLEEQITDTQENIAVAYIQNFQNMNAELFDMGIGNLKETGKENNIYERYNLNLSDMTMNDIKLFEGLTQKNDVAINSFDSQNQTFNMLLNGENVNISYKNIEVSKTLFSALENAAKTGKSVRLDFGQDTSVILRISKDGKLSADFVPNEKAMEAVLKNALPQLKAKFDEQNLPYKELTYRNFNQQQDNNKNNNKEKNKDE